MAVEVDKDKLLALKAYYLGRKVTENPQSVAVALKMIDVAVEVLSKRNGNEEKLRLLFYILLKCEITRDTDECIELRKEAKQISKDLRSSSFDYFLRIEGVTQSRKEVVGFSAGVIADSGIKDGGLREQVDSFGHVSVLAVDYASEALGVDFGSLSPNEIRFLEKTNLMEMLQHHGIDYP